MLTPAHPKLDDPLCEQKKKQFALDQAHKVKNPKSWGFNKSQAAPPKPPASKHP